MLVLSRKNSQAIMIGDGIKIVVVDIRGDKVRLGIEATNNVPVHRKEIWDLIQTTGIDTKQKEINPDAIAPTV